MSPSESMLISPPTLKLDATLRPWNSSVVVVSLPHTPPPTPTPLLDVSVCVSVLFWPASMLKSPPVLISARSEEHTSELQSLMRISYAVFCLKKKTPNKSTRLHEHTKNKIKSHTASTT